MRIALISDIHGNLMALEAALADIEVQGVEQIICLGDAVFNGPQPGPVLQRVRELGCPVVMGNTDRFFLDPPAPDPNEERDIILTDLIRWGIDRVSSDELEFLKTWPPRVEIQLDQENKLLAFHGSPNSDHDIILSTTPDAELARMLGHSRATVMAGGHTHTPMLRRYLDTLIINPGSIGMPIEKRLAPRHDVRPPWVEYAILAFGSQLRVDFSRIRYDVNALLQAARTSGMPHYDWWAAPWVNY